MGNPQYDNPGGLIAAAVILEVLAALCVGLRFYSRRWKRQAVIASDWLILVGFIFGTGLTVMEIYGVQQHALGYPLGATIEDPYAVTGRLNKAKHIELAFLLLGIATLGIIKLSVCLFYWHIFARVYFRRFLMVWSAIIVIWAASFVIAGLLECGTHLLAIFGTPQAYLAHCGSAIPSGYAMVATDILTDFITLAIPVPIILSLQMDVPTKALTLFIFMIGALSIGASIAKGYIYITASMGIYTEDAILILTGLSVWNLVEVQVGIVAACGPTLRPILSRFIAASPAASIASFLASRVRDLLASSFSSTTPQVSNDGPSTRKDQGSFGFGLGGSGSKGGRLQVPSSDIPRGSGKSMWTESTERLGRPHAGPASISGEYTESFEMSSRAEEARTGDGA